MKWSLPNQIMCFLLPVHSKPTADKMSVNKSKATFEIEQCWICEVLWWTFWKWRPVEIFQCQESIRDNIIYLHMKCRWIGQCWICAVFWWPFWKWQPVEIFQCRESIRDIIIYPHIKFWWYQTMLNFHSRFFMPCFGSHFENGRHLENFENAELLLRWWHIIVSKFMSLLLTI